MSEIKLSFKKEFAPKIRNFSKWATTRDEPKGKVGDYFVFDGYKYYLIAVFPMRLFRVAYDLYKVEGCDSFEDFVNIWNKCYPKKPYEEWNLASFWVHIFAPSHDWSEYHVLEPINSCNKTNKEKEQ